MTAWVILAASALDLVLGDPQTRRHPVCLIGKWVEWAEKALRRFGADGYVGGVVLLASTLGILGLPVFFLLKTSSSWLNAILGVIVLYFSIALGQLLREGQKIQKAIDASSMDEARNGVGRICGRQTDKLDREGLIRATVESLAENSVDGFTAPLFYAAILGPAGAWMYRIANTLDSMVGYKNEKYLRFGWASARFDDILNFIPSRLTAVLLSLGSPLVRGNLRAGFKTMWRFAALHPSPNAGWTESAVGGALGIRLGGPAFYFGREVHKPYLGDARADRMPVPQDIRRTGCMVLFACLGFALLAFLAAAYSRHMGWMS